MSWTVWGPNSGGRKGFHLLPYPSRPALSPPILLHHGYWGCSLGGGSDQGKAIPLQAWTGPEGSRRLRIPDFKTIGT